MAIYAVDSCGLDRISASGSADISYKEDSSSTDASPDSLMPGPYSFEPSESNSEGPSGTLTSSSEDDNSERLRDLSW